MRYWRVPVMDGEIRRPGKHRGLVKAVGGGNLLLLCRDTDALAVAAAVSAMKRLPNVIMPFPGGMVRAGSKLGSKYAALSASTNDAFCPTLFGLVDGSALTEQIGCVLEIVIDGLSEADVGAAMRPACWQESASAPQACCESRPATMVAARSLHSSFASCCRIWRQYERLASRAPTGP